MDPTNMEGVEGDNGVLDGVIVRMQHEARLWSKRAPGMGLPEEAPYSILAQAAIKALRSRHLLTPEAIEQIKREAGEK